MKTIDGRDRKEPVGVGERGGMGRVSGVGLWHGEGADMGNNAWVEHNRYYA